MNVICQFPHRGPTLQECLYQLLSAGKKYGEMVWKE